MKQPAYKRSSYCCPPKPRVNGGKFNLTFWITFVGIVLIVSLGASYLYLVQKAPLKFEGMDFNQDGIITFKELHYASSYGIRQISKDDSICTEYYALKDGLRLKLVCPGREE